MWLPICNIIDLMTLWLDDILSQKLILPGSIIDNAGAAGMVYLLNIMALIMLLSIPTISTWIITNGETGATRGLQAVARTIGSVIGAGAGAGLGAAFSAKKGAKGVKIGT
jgi:hypothetical protein